MSQIRPDHPYSLARFNVLNSLLAVLNRNDDKDSDFILAHYLLEHFREFEKLSIYKVAEDCYMSRSSVQRFIKNTGFDSFTQMKQSASDVHEHDKAFLTYADHVNYADHRMRTVNEMMEDISVSITRRDLIFLAGKIHDSRQVVLLNADDSASATRTFQQEMFAAGKLVRLVTNGSPDPALLAGLSKEDLLLVLSVSGNFALGVDHEVAEVQAFKCLVTLNHTTLFQNNYDHIFYLSKTLELSDREIRRIRNVYTRYALTFFFDLLFHRYFVMYQE